MVLKKIIKESIENNIQEIANASVNRVFKIQYQLAGEIVEVTGIKTADDLFRFGNAYVLTRQ